MPKQNSALRIDSSIPLSQDSISASYPLGARYVAPQNMPSVFSAGVANTWVNNNLFLWGAATADHDTFTGVYIPNTWYAVETVVWRGYFRYAGVPSLLHSIWRSVFTGKVRMYVTDDASRKKVFESATTAAPTAATRINITSDTSSAALTLTVGSYYLVEVSLDAGDLYVDFLAIETSNAYSFPTLVTFNDATTPSSANWDTAPTAQNYLNDIARQAVGSSVQVSCDAPNLAVAFYNGGFFFRGRDSSTKQDTLTITYRNFTGNVMTLKTYAIGSAVAIDTFTLTSDDVEHIDTKTLTVASYTINTFYRISVECDAGTGSGHTHYVKQILYGKDLALTTAPVQWSEGNSVQGSTSTPKMKPVAGSATTDNLTEIRTALKGASALQTSAGANNGFQFLTVDLSLGTFSQAGKSITFGPGTYRVRQWRYLAYITKDASTTATIAYGETKTATLPAAVVWTTYDLESIADLTYGMYYSVTGVAPADRLAVMEIQS